LFPFSIGKEREKVLHKTEKHFFDFRGADFDSTAGRRRWAVLEVLPIFDGQVEVKYAL
jgi:hypothetical protein